MCSQKIEVSQQRYICYYQAVMAQSGNLEILYEDELCIVVNKPAGLAVQGGKGINRSLDSMLGGMFSQRPLLVHRLDRDTSGIVLVAKTKEAAARYSRLLARDSIPHSSFPVKKYLAVCSQRPAGEQGIISLELSFHGSVKKCETSYRLLKVFSGAQEYSLLELELGTGRMHQIRRHLAMIGSPILGDDKYGNFTLNHQLRKTMKLRNLLLHASELIIPETPDGARLEILAPPPDYFLDFIKPT